jgi:Spy/CpxP family protein refolding chaperone
MRWKATILVVAVFLLGVVLGGAALYMARSVWGDGPSRGPHFGPPGPERDARVVEQMTRDLDLTPEQQAQLAASLEETRKQMNAVYDSIRPQIQQLREQGRDRIRAFLTPEQREKFEAMLARFDEERRRRNQR